MLDEKTAPTTIHRITTVAGDARRQHRGVAGCPRRHEAVELDVCAGCPYLRAPVPDPSGGARRMLCVVDRDADPVEAAPGTVGALMSRDVICVKPDVPLEDLVPIFLERRMGGLPVVDDEDKPIGVVSKSDVVKAYAEGRLRRGELDSFDPTMAEAPRAVTAADVMSPIGCVLREEEPIARAAEVFAAAGIHRAPVISAAGRIVGVITTFDLLRAIP